MKYKISILLWLFSHVIFACPLEGAVINEQVMLWPHGIVPYYFDTKLSKDTKKAILNAIELWEAQTVVRFVQIAPGRADDYVVFVPAEGRTCISSVGRQGGMQTIRLAPRCKTMGIAHELGHVLGLWHEQGRVDRDLYIDVLWENIQKEHVYNFDIRTDDGQNIGEYDYDSIMHYSAYAFSKNGKPTLKPHDESARIGQRTHISVGDAKSINLLYAGG